MDWLHVAVIIWSDMTDVYRINFPNNNEIIYNKDELKMTLRT